MKEVNIITEDAKKPVQTGRDPHWRPVMMSRNTAMFTIPVDVRDEAHLVEIHNEDRGAYVTWDAEKREIRISVIDPETNDYGYVKPKPQVVVKKKDKEDKEDKEEKKDKKRGKKGKKDVEAKVEDTGAVESETTDETAEESAEAETGFEETASEPPIEL